MRLALLMNHEELVQLQTSIVVETWDKRLGGRVKRAWIAEFNESERKKAAKLYTMFYNWHLRKGIPQTHIFRHGTLPFIQRLVHFFGTVQTRKGD